MCGEQDKRLAEWYPKKDMRVTPKPTGMGEYAIALSI